MVLGVTEISAIVAAGGVLIGVAYYILDMRNQARIRQMDLTMRLYEGLLTQGIIRYLYKMKTLDDKEYSDYINKEDGWSELMTISTYHEEVGFLLHKKLLPINMAKELFAESTKRIWEKNELWLKKAHSDKAFWFEYLYNEMKKREQKLQQSKAQS